jgi:hypothetical protein
VVTITEEAATLFDAEVPLEGEVVAEAVGDGGMIDEAAGDVEGGGIVVGGGNPENPILLHTSSPSLLKKQNLLDGHVSVQNLELEGDVVTDGEAEVEIVGVTDDVGVVLDDAVAEFEIEGVEDVVAETLIDDVGEFEIEEVGVDVGEMLIDPEAESEIVGVVDVVGVMLDVELILGEVDDELDKLGVFEMEGEMDDDTDMEAVAELDTLAVGVVLLVRFPEGLVGGVVGPKVMATGDPPF